jgi:hypothetical protein
MRTGEFSRLKLNDVQIYELRNEFDYYLLPIPQDLQLNMEWDVTPSKKPVNGTFSDNNLKITKITGGNDYNCPVIGSYPVSKFTVQIISGKNIMIGFSPIDQFKQNGYHYNLSNVFFSEPGTVMFITIAVNLSLKVPNLKSMICSQ